MYMSRRIYMSRVAIKGHYHSCRIYLCWCFCLSWPICWCWSSCPCCCPCCTPPPAAASAAPAAPVAALLLPVCHSCPCYWPCCPLLLPLLLPLLPLLPLLSQLLLLLLPLLLPVCHCCSWCCPCCYPCCCQPVIVAPATAPAAPLAAVDADNWKWCLLCRVIWSCRVPLLASRFARTYRQVLNWRLACVPLLDIFEIEHVWYELESDETRTCASEASEGWKKWGVKICEKNMFLYRKLVVETKQWRSQEVEVEGQKSPPLSSPPLPSPPTPYLPSPTLFSPLPSLTARGATSSPNGVWGGAPAASNFGAF